MVPEQRDSRMTAVLPIYTYMSTHSTQEHTHILYTDRYKNENSKDLKITFKMRLVCNLDGKNVYFVILFLIYWWIYGPIAITSNNRISFKWINVQYNSYPTKIFIVWTLLFKTTQNASPIPSDLAYNPIQYIIAIHHKASISGSQRDDCFSSFRSCDKTLWPKHLRGGKVYLPSLSLWRWGQELKTKLGKKAAGWLILLLTHKLLLS